jgi:hypothetical protein
MVAKRKSSDETPPDVPVEASADDLADSTLDADSGSPVAPDAAAVAESDATHAFEQSTEISEHDAEAAPLQDSAIHLSMSPRTYAIVAGVLVVVLAVAGWFLLQGGSGTATPQSAAETMLRAYAVYDAKGILASVTHDSLTSDDVTRFTTQAATAEKKSGGKPAVKDVKIGKVALGSGGNSATVEVTARWFDSSKGAYVSNTQQVPVVKKNGKWLVQLF